LTSFPGSIKTLGRSIAILLR